MNEKRNNSARRRAASEDERRTKLELANLRKGAAAAKQLVHSIRALNRAAKSTRGPARGGDKGSQAGAWIARSKSPAVVMKIHGGGRAGDAYGERGGRLLDGNLGGLTARDRSAAWDLEQARRPRLSNLMCHLSFSRPEGYPLTDAQWRDLLQAWLKEVGASENAFVAHLHEGVHQHVHVVFSRARPDGSVVSDAWQRLRWREALRRAEALCGLKEVDRPTDAPGDYPSERAHAALRRSERRKTVPAWVDPIIVRAAIARSRNPVELQQQLAAVGVELQISKRQDGTARGLLLRRAGADEWLAGTSVARDLSLARVTAALEENAHPGGGAPRYSQVVHAHPRQTQQPAPRPRGG